MGRMTQPPTRSPSCARPSNRAARALRDGEPTGPEPSLDRPPKPELGDYSSNAAMLLAAPAGREPARRRRAPRGPSSERELGAAAAASSGSRSPGPGFVNLFLSDAWYRRAMAGLAAPRASGLGPAPTASPERILVEFVSANPTGPLHVGGGRHAAYGDALVRLLEAVGHEVEREFYVNDAGGQVERFAALDRRPDERRGAARGRLRAASTWPSWPSGSPPRGSIPPTPRRSAGAGSSWCSSGCAAPSSASASASTPGSPSATSTSAARSRRRSPSSTQGGHTYRSEGALWLRTTEFGDDKDRVLIRANGEPTYLAADVAYHWDKLERGFERLIDVLGADHHGYVAAPARRDRRRSAPTPTASRR